MLTLPMYNTSEEHRRFGGPDRPIRPSSVPKFMKCPMSVFLASEDSSSLAAETGSLVHEAAAAYHRAEGDVDFRKEVGFEALESALASFPKGSRETARSIFSSYAADPKNQEAVVPWVEQKVRLSLAPAPSDPTGLPIVFEGTLDQVRLYEGLLQVWDIKTGSGKDPRETINEYVLQQCVYTLAARETLDPNIVFGGFIYTPGYEKPRGRRFLPLELTIEDAYILLTPVVQTVALIRQGVPMFQPSAGACEYCPVKPYSNCLSQYKGVHS